MSLLDAIFWLLIILVAVLAYSIESGLSARHRTVILSSILSATVAAIYMMFLVEDDSEFATPDPVEQEGGKKKLKGMSGIDTGDGESDLEVEQSDPARTLRDRLKRYKDMEKLLLPGGFRDCPKCPLMTLILEGEVVVGSPADERGRRSNEGPQKVVRFNTPFTVSRYEIKFGEFAEFVRDSRHRPADGCYVNGSYSTEHNWQKPGYEQRTADHPVVCISYQDAGKYAEWLTKKTKRTYKLLSESEWAYVARAGTITPYWTGREITEDQANFAIKFKRTLEGGTFRDNEFKLFDVSGNVWEMVEDCWMEDLEKMPSSGVANLAEGNCTMSAIRGGGWESPIEQLRIAFRQPLPRTQALNTVGIRLAREIK